MPMQPDYQQAMRDLLLLTYPDDTIRDFVLLLPDGPTMRARLPGGHASPLQLAGEAVKVLLKFGRTEDALKALEHARPLHRDTITEIRAGLAHLDSWPAPEVCFNPAPSLPPHYVEVGDLAGFCEAVRRRPGFAGISGPLGAGKTVFAAAAAATLAPDFARICWLSPEDGAASTPVDLQRQLYAQLSEGRFEPAGWKEGRARLAECISRVIPAGERLLVLVDTPPDPVDQVLEALRIYPAMSLVCCTENLAALHSLGADPLVELSGLPTSESLKLLAGWCGCRPEELPPVASELVAAVGGLPLAVSVIGAMLSLSGDRAAECSALREDLRAGKVDRLELPGLDTNVLTVLRRALSTLHPASREELHLLALLPANIWLEPDQLARLWAADCMDDARRRADRLAIRSLLRRKDSHYALHLLSRLVLRAVDDRLVERFCAAADRVAPDYPLLVLALNWGDGEVFDALILASDAEAVNREAPEGVTALHLAALRRNSSATERLLGQGADPHRVSDDGFSTLHYAAQGGDLQTLKLLLDASADVTHRNVGGKTALDVAAAAGHLEAVRLLATVPGTVQAAKFGLMAAAVHDYVDVAAALLAAGADPDVSPEGDSPPMHAAAIKGRTAIAELLLRAGARADIRFEDQTPLFLAAAEGHQAIAELLLQAGADPAFETGAGRTVMHQAAQSGSAPIIARLADAGAPIDRRDAGGLTPLHIAASLGHVGVATTLAARGAKVDRFDNGQITPLLRATAGNYPGVVEALLQVGADPSRSGQRGFSPLLLAVAGAPPSIVQQNRLSMDHEGGHLISVTLYRHISDDTISIIRALAAAGADLDAQDADGLTALHWAVRKQSPELTELLLELGADQTRQDENGRTPRALADACALHVVDDGPLVSLRARAVASLLGP